MSNPDEGPDDPVRNAQNWNEAEAQAKAMREKPFVQTLPPELRSTLKALINTSEVGIGDIVQVVPGAFERSEWNAVLVIVTEVKLWGIQGYTTSPGQGDAFIRLKAGTFEKVGAASFMRQDSV